MNNRWLWEDVQEDLDTLRFLCLIKLKKSYTREQVYDIWYAYSQSIHANWLEVDKNFYKAFMTYNNFAYYMTTTHGMYQNSDDAVYCCGCHHLLYETDYPEHNWDSCPICGYTILKEEV